MLWIFRYFLVCVSVTNLVIAEDQCRIEINIRGMTLKGFVFKRMTVAAPHICDILCEREITCQSYNFNRKEQICELNNRTKDVRPENFRSDPAWFYIRRLNGRVPLGSIPELPARSCREITASEGKNTASNKYWLDPSGTGKAVLVYCGFTAVFTNLGKNGTEGPNSVGSHYTGQDHDGQVTVSSGIQLWTVPHTGEYRIETIGASGGYSEDSVINGGRGARMIGNFMLTKDEIIRILVGQRGERSNSYKNAASGGGGTFVVRGEMPLIIAGGGGGVAKMTEQHSGCDASINTTGNAGYNSPFLSGGSNGNGGQTDKPHSGGGGGGFNSNGEDSQQSHGGGKGGKGFLAGGEGGKQQGGFGGGGGSRFIGEIPGGGGGYSGEVEVRIKIFPVGEGEDLSTTEQISKMNVVIKLLDMVK
ncbi:leukocyte tyrosine kinase receptor-like [Pocillopora verrucosa]|uniref:leukocyte tyrosine kinase receptor-like n=1 Tax=Pocillopora verrucosa TaxID=203993 RepID=UPI00334131AA